jgi:pSer/pThr/pTyr-binding forkhead associated (FHA) protein
MTDQRIKQGVWRYNPTIIENEAGEPIAAMVKSTNGRYVEHSELFVSAISNGNRWREYGGRMQLALLEIEKRTRPDGDMADQAVNELARNALTEAPQS